MAGAKAVLVTRTRRKVAKSLKTTRTEKTRRTQSLTHQVSVEVEDADVDVDAVVVGVLAVGAVGAVGAAEVLHRAAKQEPEQPKHRARHPPKQ